MHQDGSFLALNWQCGKVLRYLRAGPGQKLQFVWFLRERHYERFFEPIRCLIQAEASESGFGFSIISLCCLLIETIECYRLGWPSSSAKELSQLEASPHNLTAPSVEFKLTGPFDSQEFSSERAFINFFDEPQHRLHFPDLSGKGQDFYKSIRCGLLHQAQTKMVGGYVPQGSVTTIPRTKRALTGTNLHRLCRIVSTLFYESWRTSSGIILFGCQCGRKSGG
jgi:hypothetical protein